MVLLSCLTFIAGAAFYAYIQHRRVKVSSFSCFLIVRVSTLTIFTVHHKDVESLYSDDDSMGVIRMKDRTELHTRRHWMELNDELNEIESTCPCYRKVV